MTPPAVAARSGSSSTSGWFPAPQSDVVLNLSRSRVSTLRGSSSGPHLGAMGIAFGMSLHRCPSSSSSPAVLRVLDLDLPTSCQAHLHLMEPCFTCLSSGRSTTSASSFRTRPSPFNLTHPHYFQHLQKLPMIRRWAFSRGQVAKDRSTSHMP